MEEHGSKAARTARQSLVVVGGFSAAQCSSGGRPSTCSGAGGGTPWAALWLRPIVRPNGIGPGISGTRPNDGAAAARMRQHLRLRVTSGSFNSEIMMSSEWLSSAQILF